MRLGIGRHHRPRGPRGAGGVEQRLVGFLIRLPLLARFQVAYGEFPVLGFVVNSLLQAQALLFKTDVQHELEDDRAVLGQHALKVVDLRKALRCLLWRYPAVHRGHQHVFIVTAVENHDLARARHFLVNAPQVVVRALFLGGRFPPYRVHAQRAHAAEDAAQRAVFARGVGALQNDQHLEAPISVKQVLQRIQRHRQRLGGGDVALLIAAGKRLGCGVKVGQLAACAFAVAFVGLGFQRRRLPFGQYFGRRPDGSF